MRGVNLSGKADSEGSTRVLICHQVPLDRTRRLPSSLALRLAICHVC
jgi:hypothetical protein